MKNSALIDIFSWNEFQNYLSNNELIELSMVCKLSRNKLKFIISRTFYYKQFIATKDYASYFIEEDSDEFYEIDEKLMSRQGQYQNYYYEDCYDAIRMINPYKPLAHKFIESKGSFKADLMMHNYQPRKLVISCVEDTYYLLYDIPSIFYNISSLVLHKSTIVFELFQYLLDSLKSLENLEFTDNKLIKPRKDSKDFNIKWPTSLKRLKIGDNLIGYIKDKEHPILVNLENGIELDADCLQLAPVHLPNLKSLYCKMNFTRRYDNEIYNIMSANSHVNKFKINTDHYDTTLFSIISTFNNLTHLDLSGYCYDCFSSEWATLLVLNSIKRLDLRFMSNNPEVFHRIAHQFPNVIDLSLETVFTEFEHICSFISIFKFLKNLKLMPYSRLAEYNNYNFPKLNNLETLELLIRNLNCINEISWNVDNCKKLQLIKFTKSEYDEKFKKPKLSKKLLINWDYIYFPRKISFYRK